MKTKTKIRLFSIIIIASFLGACSATNPLTMSVTQPAPITVPENIKKVGLINRNKPTDKTNILSKLDKILSFEGKNLDKEASDNALKGLFEELKKNDRFTKVVLLEGEDVKGTGMGVFPAEIPASTVEDICSRNALDALFVLSYYDTDAKVKFNAEKVDIATPLGVSIPGVKQKLTVNTIIKTGWRIYDYKNKTVLDENQIPGGIVSVGEGINPIKAAESIVGRKQAILQESTQIGRSYAHDLLPYRLRVSRIYFVRGSNKFKIAKRRARVGDWDGAAELWEEEIDNPKRKAAGRAHYNMAIINEIRGNLDEAIEWAKKSYADYKIKQALRYLDILRYRKNQENRLEQQKTN